MSGASTKRNLLLAGLAAAGLVILAWSQPWFEITLTTGAELSVGGSIAAPALTPLSLAGLALVAALALAGVIFRMILGAVEMLLGVGVITSSTLALGDPLHTAGPLVSALTGITGDESVRELVSTASVTAWPWVAVVAGAALVAVGILILITGRRWTQASAKYDSTATAHAGTASDWDALSDGADPTAR